MESRLKGFYKLSPQDRLQLLKKLTNLTKEDLDLFREGPSMEDFDKRIENVVGAFKLPLGIATNFLINNKDYLIPMVIEEPSVVAAASKAAKLARIRGGFRSRSSEQIMIGQVQLFLNNPKKAIGKIKKAKDQILKKANKEDPILTKLGGGAKDLELRTLETYEGKMLVVHLLVDCRDVMGANVVNTMCEAIAPLLEKLTVGKAYLRILSNLAVKRTAYAEALFPKEYLRENSVEGILKAFAFAQADPYRAATHNKGIMNGIDAVAIATGNDWRAVEAGAHSYAAINGYLPLTKWSMKDGDLHGEIELPLALGTFGGATMHPESRVCQKILSVKSAKELAGVMASVGLAQNFAALYALSTTGIQDGHMRLHARNFAVAAGAKGKMIDEVVEEMVKKKKIRIDYAKELVKKKSVYL